MGLGRHKLADSTLFFFIKAVWKWQSTHASSESTAAPEQWDHTHCTTPYHWALSLDNNRSQVDLSQSTWMSLQGEWMKQQFFNRQKEREHCGSVTRAFVIACTEVNTSIVGQAHACLSLSHSRWQLGCVTPLSPWWRQMGGGECNHCLPIKPEEVSPWLCPLLGQGVGGAAVARSGITGPGRKEPDPGACLGQPLPPAFLQLWAAVMQTVGPLCWRCRETLGQRCCCWEKECSWSPWDMKKLRLMCV